MCVCVFSFYYKSSNTLLSCRSLLYVELLYMEFLVICVPSAENIVSQGIPKDTPALLYITVTMFNSSLDVKGCFLLIVMLKKKNTIPESLISRPSWSHIFLVQNLYKQNIEVVYVLTGIEECMAMLGMHDEGTENEEEGK